MNEVSKCAAMSGSSFDNRHLALEGISIEVWVLKTTVRKLLLSSLVYPNGGTSFEIVCNSN